MRTFGRLGKSGVGGLSHLSLDVLEEGLKALGEGGPVGKRREARVDDAVALVDVAHVDLRDETDRGRHLGVVGPGNNLELIHTALMSGL